MPAPEKTAKRGKADSKAAAPTPTKRSKKQLEPESEDNEESSEDKAEEEEKMVQLPVDNADEAKIQRRPVFEAVIKNLLWHK